MMVSKSRALIVALIAATTLLGCSKKQPDKTDKTDNNAKPTEATASAGCSADSLKVPELGFCVTAPGYKVDGKDPGDEGSTTVRLWKAGNTVIVTVRPGGEMPADMTTVVGTSAGDTQTTGDTPSGGKWVSNVHGTVQTVQVMVKGPKAVFSCGVSGSDIKETFDICKSIAAL